MSYWYQNGHRERQIVCTNEIISGIGIGDMTIPDIVINPLGLQKRSW